MNLRGADGEPHTFWVDYDGDGIADSGEPLSPFFIGSTGITYEFIATSAEGPYSYKCSFHPFSMFGDFTVSAAPVHDLAVIGLSVSRSFAYGGVSSNPVRVDVTVANQGSVQESFATTFLANGVSQGSQQVTLAPGESGVVSFDWDAHLLARGSYDLSATVPVLSGETDSADNSFSGSSFVVRMKGDVNNDCVVNIVDLATVGANFGKTPASPGFNPSADLNNDLIINIVDLVVVGGTFGQVCT